VSGPKATVCFSRDGCSLSCFALQSLSQAQRHVGLLHHRGQKKKINQLTDPHQPSVNNHKRSADGFAQIKTL